MRFAVIERFCRILGAMLKAGVPVPEAMTAAIEATNNRVYQEALLDRPATRCSRRGDLPADRRTLGLFPAAARQMMRVGEESGTLDTQLEPPPTYYEARARLQASSGSPRCSSRPSSWSWACIVGFVAIALVSAMYGIFNQVNIK